MTLPDEPVPNEPPPVPWFATPVEYGERNPALRPVREDEIEELDEVGPWEEDQLPAEQSRAGAYVDPARRPACGPDDGSALVSLAVGRALRARRRELHLSQTAFGVKTGRTQGTVSMMERGRNGLTVLDLVQIALETGRSIRLNVFPDDGYGEDMGRVESVALGVSGSVRIAIGPARPAGATPGHGPDRRPRGPIF